MIKPGKEGTRPHTIYPTNEKKPWARLISRDVAGAACLSGVSICAIIFLVWMCVTRGECLHHGPDACLSRRSRAPGIDTSPGFQGNNDVYGFGIRLGIYCQWFASIIANALLDENIRRSTTAPYLGFQLAMLAALLYLVFRSDCTFTAEVFIILYILLGGVFVVLAPELVQSFRHVRWKEESRPKYRVFNTFVWILLAWVVPVSAWFWIRVAVTGARTDFFLTPGGTSAFLVARVRNEHIRLASIFMAVWSVLLGIFALEKVAFAFLYKALGFELRPLLLILTDVFFRVIHTLFLLFKAASRHILNSYNTDVSKPLHEYIRESLSVQVNLSLGDICADASSIRSEVVTRLYAFALASINVTMSICAVELTLAWNHISGVHSLASTGQIVALFVGMSTFASVFWQVSKKVRSDLADTSTGYGEDPPPYDLEASMWQLADIDHKQLDSLVDQDGC